MLLTSLHNGSTGAIGKKGLATELVVCDAIDR